MRKTLINNMAVVVHQASNICRFAYLWARIIHTIRVNVIVVLVCSSVILRRWVRLYRLQVRLSSRPSSSILHLMVGKAIYVWVGVERKARTLDQADVVAFLSGVRVCVLKSGICYIWSTSNYITRVVRLSALVDRGLWEKDHVDHLRLVLAMAFATRNRPCVGWLSTCSRRQWVKFLALRLGMPEVRTICGVCHWPVCLSRRGGQSLGHCHVVQVLLRCWSTRILHTFPFAVRWLFFTHLSIASAVIHGSLWLGCFAALPEWRDFLLLWVVVIALR